MVPLTDILFFKAYGNFLILYFISDSQIRNCVIQTKFGTCCALLRKIKFFFKVHRSYLVNCLHIIDYETYPQDHLLIEKYEETFTIPLSRFKKLEFHNYYSKIYKNL